MTPSQDPADRGAARGPRRLGEKYRDAARQDTLHTAGELVERGGLAGGLAVLLYVVVGAAFWSLIGWLLDHLLGTRWIVIAGAVFGASAGVYLGYLHMRDALNRSHTPADPVGDKDVV
ncbi:AtpZ/AtpI family protein [Kocuria tytonicola]|uniref:AtpZ/AtpI family protein n=1 Tax=Kocuria tytonicola TaxID=2055946 RepID=UPI001F0BE1A6|nr:AtpZ/AtpI family protein [Kocuria tytonicola]